MNKRARDENFAMIQRSGTRLTHAPLLHFRRTKLPPLRVATVMPVYSSPEFRAESNGEWKCGILFLITCCLLASLAFFRASRSCAKRDSRCFNRSRSFCMRSLSSRRRSSSASCCREELRRFCRRPGVLMLLRRDPLGSEELLFRESDEIQRFTRLNRFAPPSAECAMRGR